MIQEWISDLKKEFDGYNFYFLGKDILAGLTVAAVALPLALAFAVSSGAEAGAGLITAIFASIIIGLFSGGYYQISGPTGTMAVILTSVSISHGMTGIFVATFLAGVLRLLSGILKFGKLTSFIPAPVVTGFTSGIAVMIALGQIDNFFGVSSEGANIIDKLFSYVRLGFSPDMTTTIMAVSVVLLMVFYPKKLNSLLPSSLIAILLATGVTIVFGLNVLAVGEIPQTLLPKHRLTFSALTTSNIISLLPAGVSIAILGMIESLLCGASASKMTGVKLKNNQELVAQGIGNMILPFLGGIPATAAIARTSVAIKSGSVTRMTSMFHGLGLMACMLLFAPTLSKIPLAALAGVLFVTAFRMNDWDSIIYFLRNKFKGATWEFFATMIATIVFDLTIAILTGVLIGLIFLVIRLSRIEINYEIVDMSRMNVKDSELCDRYSSACVVYITGPMIFANVQSIEDITKETRAFDTILFSMRGVSNIDISCAQVMHEFLDMAEKRGIDVAICGLPTQAMEMMKRSGLYERLGDNNFYWSTGQALLDLRAVPKCKLPKNPIEDD